MAYYVRENLPASPVLGERRPVINEFFLSSYTLSIYSGCEFGCPYCDVWSYFARPLNQMVQVPVDLPHRLADELTTVDRGDVIGITTLSDPYQPAERTYGITRQVLHLFAEVGQPCVILTKGTGILDDIPILQRINERSLAVVMMTLLTVDARLSERLEGKSPPPGLRLDALATLKRAGLPVGVAIAPIMPYINDTTPVLTPLLRACRDSGVDFVVWDFLHIPDRMHYSRVKDITTRIGTFPSSYYTDIYHDQPVPDKHYRTERNAEILERCDTFGLSVRAPHTLFAGKIKRANEVALYLKRAAFRDAVQGRDNMASLHRDLSHLVYQERAAKEHLKISPLWSELQEIWGADW